MHCEKGFCDAHAKQHQVSNQHYVMALISGINCQCFACNCTLIPKATDAVAFNLLETLNKTFIQ